MEIQLGHLFLFLLWYQYQPSRSWTYYASTGDVIQLHCQLKASSYCARYNNIGGSDTPPFNVVWVYSSLPPDADLSSGRKVVSFPQYETTSRPPWMPDFPVAKPQAVKTGGRFSIFSTSTNNDLPEIVLQIYNITWRDAGTYVCYCGEDIPPSAMAVHQLVVFGRPYVIISAYEVGYHYAVPSTRIVSEKNTTYTKLTLAPDSNVTLTCVYSNTVFPIRKFVWLKDGNDLASSSSDNSLDILYMSKEDRGAYACRVILTDSLNATGPAFKLNVPEPETTTHVVIIAKRDEFPVLLVIVLACVLFVVVLMTLVTILVVKALSRQQRDRVRFTLPNSFSGYDDSSPRRR